MIHRRRIEIISTATSANDQSTAPVRALTKPSSHAMKNAVGGLRMKKGRQSVKLACCSRRRIARPSYGLPWFVSWCPPAPWQTKSRLAALLPDIAKARMHTPIASMEAAAMHSDLRLTGDATRGFPERRRCSRSAALPASDHVHASQWRVAAIDFLGVAASDCGLEKITERLSE